MVIKFNNIYLEALSKDDIKGKPKYNKEIITKFKKTLKILQQMPDTKSLWTLNSLGFESLKGERKGYFSVRVSELTNHYQ